MFGWLNIELVFISSLQWKPNSSRVTKQLKSTIGFSFFAFRFFVRVRGDVYIRHLTHTYTQSSMWYLTSLAPERPQRNEATHFHTLAVAWETVMVRGYKKTHTTHTHSSFWCSGLVRITSKLDCLKSESYVADTALHKNTHRTKHTHGKEADPKQPLIYLHNPANISETIRPFKAASHIYSSGH